MNRNNKIDYVDFQFIIQSFLSYCHTMQLCGSVGSLAASPKKKKNMRKLLYLLFIFTTLSCNKTNKPIDNAYLDEYRCPADSLINPKVFVYEKNDSIDNLRFFLRQVKMENGDKICIYVRLDSENRDSIRDSTVSYYRDKNLIVRDEYTLVKNNKTNKDRVIKSKILDYFDSPKERVIETKYTSPFNESLVCTNTEVSFLAKKTKFKIYNKDVECVIMAKDIFKKIRHKYIPFMGKDVEMTGITIYAKGMGMVYTRIYNKTYNSDNSIRLKEIIDYPTYLKKYCTK